MRTFAKIIHSAGMMANGHCRIYALSCAAKAVMVMSRCPGKIAVDSGRRARRLTHPHGPMQPTRALRPEVAGYP